MTEAPIPVNSIVSIPRLGHHGAMRTAFAISGFALALAACAPLSIYYRPGVPVARMQTDTTQCEVQALREAPVANQIRQRPPIYYPGTQYCDASGACVTRPGYWVDGGFYTVDVNRDLRARVQDLCMAKKGYQPVSLPNCPVTLARSVAPDRTRILPALTEDSCAIRYDDGSWQIVTPQAPVASQ